MSDSIDINKNKIILWGPSIGGAVSTYMAKYATEK